MSEDLAAATRTGVPAPSPARVYGYWLGGKDHFAVDRRAGDQVAAVAPCVVAAARANRAFLRRAVTAMARDGLNQFLDLGCGMPVGASVHEVAQRRMPAAKVLYADDDEVVLAHARAIWGGDPGVVVLPWHAGRLPDLIDDPTTIGHLDLSRPVGVLLTTVLHTLTDTAARALLTALHDALAPDSQVALSHPAAPEAGRPSGHTAGEHLAATMTQATTLYSTRIGPCRLRTADDLAHLLDGWTLLDPGLTDAGSWRRLPGRSHQRLPVLAGLARRETP